MKSPLSSKQLHTLARNLSVSSDRSIREVLAELSQDEGSKLIKLISFYKNRRKNKHGRANGTS